MSGPMPVTDKVIVISLCVFAFGCLLGAFSVIRELQGKVERITTNTAELLAFVGLTTVLITIIVEILMRPIK